VRQAARSALVLITAAVAAFAGTPANASVPGPSWDTTGPWTRTFSASFTTGTGGVWQNTWWPGGQNSAFTACYSPSHEQAPGDGFAYLTLTAAPSSCYGTTQPYTGAVLDTHAGFYQTGGAFEARVSLPCNAAGQVYGWPAVWSDDDQFTTEMDWVEGGIIASGQDGGTAAHLVYNGGNPGQASATPECGWHRFGVQWDAAGQTATFYWDSKRFFGPLPFPATGADYLILGYQMCSRCVAPPAGGATMKIYYDRVWAMTP
jgi:hypothetical protein